MFVLDADAGGNRAGYLPFNRQGIAGEIKIGQEGKKASGGVWSEGKSGTTEPVGICQNAEILVVKSSHRSGKTVSCGVYPVGCTLFHQTGKAAQKLANHPLAGQLWQLRPQGYFRGMGQNQADRFGVIGQGQAAYENWHTAGAKHDQHLDYYRPGWPPKPAANWPAVTGA